MKNKIAPKKLANEVYEINGDVYLSSKDYTNNSNPIIEDIFYNLEFELLTYTCSMTELSNFNIKDVSTLFKYFTEKAVKKFVLDYLIYLTGPDIKVFIYNTNCNKNSKTYNLLQKVGFVPVFEYKGNQGKVITFMLEV